MSDAKEDGKPRKLHRTSAPVHNQPPSIPKTDWAKVRSENPGRDSHFWLWTATREWQLVCWRRTDQSFGGLRARDGGFETDLRLGRQTPPTSPCVSTAQPALFAGLRLRILRHQGPQMCASCAKSAQHRLPTDQEVGDSVTILLRGLESVELGPGRRHGWHWETRAREEAFQSFCFSRSEDEQNTINAGADRDASAAPIGAI